MCHSTDPDYYEGRRGESWEKALCYVRRPWSADMYMES